MGKFLTGLKELTSNTSERTAVLAGIVIKLLCLYAPPACGILTTATGYIGMTPDTFVGALITYALLRFSSKVQKA